ncbi:polyphosphate kinase 2 family protein [Bremerella cremea]|uniref:Polyphosphate kinase 2 family protein n=1 Tax=Bremerella cremea TaxID=1031537 RepID=A0A368KMJ0_9BACT|nr:polyphosphate kinase 2 family protein [Bremerella cremea]RCS43525.1 polyphosphate kinase 2 family protein [Bremerella cremea]
MDYYERFRVTPGSKVDLDKFDPSHKKLHNERQEAEQETIHLRERIRDLQYQMYAERKRSLLVVLQGRDAAGKDGTVRHVFRAMNPQGCRVVSFKVPSKEEAEHDFLWRCHKVTPGLGHITVFNRSHYEDVLVQRVHNIVPKEVWSKRYEQINNFEKMLHENGTHILKFYLHIDQEEQLERFKKRLDKPAKNWKISESDYSERPFWDEYTKAFEEALRRCSTEYAPWFIIPSNRKWFRNLVVARILVAAFESFQMQFPEPTVDLKEIRRLYHDEVKKENDE